ncbi:MAG: HlyC/CorC family transporter [Acidobacteria bacterium]|nr:MAG: HlyC/CorC family transporter [Acidobacteriota bacterium]
MDFLIPVLIIAILILLNGLFVGAEFAIIGAPRAAIERRAVQGHRAAKLVRRVLRHPRLQDRYIATAQLGITFASLGLGMYGEHIVAGWIARGLEGIEPSWLLRWVAAHTIASVLAVTILTYFHIVLGEMVPKSLALMHAEATVLRITRLMSVIEKLLYPLVLGLNGLGNALLKLMGIQRQIAAGHYHTAEDLEFIVRESHEGGLLRKEAAEVLRSLFEFDQLTAREVMVPRVRVIGVPLEAGPTQLAETICKWPHTRYPVYTGNLDQIVGIVHIKDILRLMREARPLRRGDVRPTAFVPETAELDRLLKAMRAARTQLLVVMDEYGGTAGIVSIEDLGQEALGGVEEDSNQVPEIRRDQAGRLVTLGTVRLHEIGESLGLALEHDEVDTVGGLVLTLLGRPPRIGDVVHYRGLRFEVTAVEGHGVRECAVSPAGDQPGG